MAIRTTRCTSSMAVSYYCNAREPTGVDARSASCAHPFNTNDGRAARTNRAIRVRSGGRSAELGLPASAGLRRGWAPAVSHVRVVSQQRWRGAPHGGGAVPAQVRSCRNEVGEAAQVQRRRKKRVQGAGAAQRGGCAGERACVRTGGTGGRTR
ncbi:hypothetical protein FGB62_150g04 [Gracilaria domingensis]|nr:hypothetical protein FGB62_150g04 [Gracilaria domingensis]